MKNFTKLFLSALLILNNNSLFAASKYSRSYTINPNFKIQGAVYRPSGSRDDKIAYGDEVASTIIMSAHEKAKKFLELGDFKAYYAFLTLALTVPLHEGGFLQYEESNAEACNQYDNSGGRMKSLGGTYFSLFKKYLLSGENPFLANCKKLKKGQRVNQMIHGADGTDISIMQVSLRWNYDTYLVPQKYKSLELTIDFGLDMLMQGFDEIYRNARNYSCLTFFGRVNYINLIRGTWAGKYNSGNIDKTCRFNNLVNHYKANDVAFLNTLNSILDFKGRIGIFELSPRMAMVVEEIVSNTKNKANKNIALDIFLKKKNNSNLYNFIKNDKNIIRPAELNALIKNDEKNTLKEDEELSDPIFEEINSRIKENVNNVQPFNFVDSISSLDEA